MIFDQTGGGYQYVLIPDAPSLEFTSAQSFTLSTWVYLNSTPSIWTGVFAKSRDIISNWYGIWIDNTGKWVFGGPANINSSTTATAGVWHLATAVQNGSANTRILYVDGVNIASGTAQNANGTGKMGIGASAPNFEVLTGLIDDARVYNRALSPS